MAKFAGALPEFLQNRFTSVPRIGDQAGRRGPIITTIFACLLLILLSCNRRNAAKKEPAVSINAEGTVRASSVLIPFSNLASQESRGALASNQTTPQLPSALSFAPGDGGVAKYRRDKDTQYYRPFVAKQLARYPVSITPGYLGGVPIETVAPISSIRSRNAHRVLINLHAGSYVDGAQYGGEIESIPIAATMGIKVVSVDYRLAPEYTFPSAVDDVLAVYSELLTRNRAKDVGIYGCSAGGELAAQVVASLISRNREVPGALGVFCGSLGNPFGDGDSVYVAPLLMGVKPPEPQRVKSRTPQEISYFRDVDSSNPLAFPEQSKTLLGRFPPTLFITGTRSPEMSSAARSHLRLFGAHVRSELFIWDGQQHAFLYNSDLPEAREAYTVIADFFDRHLRVE